ncbi:MAG: hypothetical protein ACLQBX_05390, partial [Candidatus Limnocylindrales bacterium]
MTVELPRARLVGRTGRSGSGKSSLAVDTIYAQGQRRYAGGRPLKPITMIGSWRWAVKDKTVKNYVSSTLAKLNLKGRPLATAFVARHRLPGAEHGARDR